MASMRRLTSIRRHWGYIVILALPATMVPAVGLAPVTAARAAASESRASLSVDGSSVVSVGRVSALSPVSTAAVVAAPIVSKRLWVIPAYWRDSPPSASFVAALPSVVQRSVEFYRDESQGRIKIALAGVRPVLKLPHPMFLTCPAFDAFDQARASLKGLFRPATDIAVLAFPPGQACGTGLAEQPGTAMYVADWDRPGTLAHELGHAVLGLGHDQRVECAAAPGGEVVALGGSCSRVEYGDPYSVMGSAVDDTDAEGRQVIGGFPALTLDRSGLRPSSMARLLTSNTSLTLSPRGATAGTNTAVIPWRNDTKYGRATLVLEYRSAVGSDDWIDNPDNHAGPASPGSGVVVTLTGRTPWSSKGGGLLNMNPTTMNPPDSAGVYRPALQAGGAWTTPDGAVTLAVVAVTGDAATVTVTRRADTTRPYATTMAAPRTIRRKSGRVRVALSWVGRGDDVAVREFRYQVDHGHVFTVRGDTAISIGAQTKGAAVVSVRRGRHILHVTAVDYAAHSRTSTRRFIAS